MYSHNEKDCPDILTDQKDDQSAEDECIGHHETQVSEGGEADLHKHLIGCTKNPGHKKFIPVDKFTVKHLPEGHKHIELYELIIAAADLTVRVAVQMISPKRPAVWPQTHEPYPFYDMRALTNLRLGSGRVRNVKKFQYGVNDKSGLRHLENYTKCWCKNCEDSNSPSSMWWEFYVATATHVVFDQIEASHTSLRLFYNSDDSPVVIVDKVVVDSVNIEFDWCMLKCVTCDEKLGNDLMQMEKRYDDVWSIVLKKYCESRDVNKLTFLVSHPHGCSKQVSVGQWKRKHQVGLFSNNNKFIYTTSTCPGSSGASVHCVGYTVGWITDLVHCGSLRNGLNYSGAGYVN